MYAKKIIEKPYTSSTFVLFRQASTGAPAVPTGGGLPCPSASRTSRWIGAGSAVGWPWWGTSAEALGVFGAPEWCWESHPGIVVNIQSPEDCRWSGHDGSLLVFSHPDNLGYKISICRGLELSVDERWCWWGSCWVVHPESSVTLLLLLIWFFLYIFSSLLATRSSRDRNSGFQSQKSQLRGRPWRSLIWTSAPPTWTSPRPSRPW